MTRIGLTITTTMCVLRYFHLIDVSYWVCLVPLFSEFLLTALMICLVFVKILIEELYNKWKNL